MSDQRMALVPLDPNQLATTLATASDCKNAKFRPHHTGANAHEWIQDTDVEADSKKEAKAALRQKTHFHWVRQSPQFKPPGEILRCGSHVDCRALAKVVQRPATGKYLLFRTPTAHADTDVTRTGGGIAPKYIDKVDALLQEYNGQPTKVQNTFILGDDYKYATLEAGNNTDALPTAAQCKARAKVLRQQGAALDVPDFTTKADTDAYAVMHACPDTKEEILKLPPLQPFILPGGYFWSENTGAMFVMSCLAVIQNVFHEFKANGSTGEIGVKADATFNSNKKSMGTAH